MRKTIILARLIFLLFFIAVFIKGWVYLHCGFRIDKIEPKEFFKNKLKIENISNIDASIFDQKYKFLNKGRQSFVFVSEDQKYVIKFFRFHRYRMPVISRFFCENKYVNSLRKEKLALYKETMNSYILVFEKLQKETATVYVHLNKTGNLNKKIEIRDKFGFRHKLNLDDLGFVVQKKVKPFLEVVLREKDPKALEDLLLSFLNNLNSMYKLNIFNNDRHVLQNLGVIDDRVVEIDIGRFARNDDLQKKEIFENEINHYVEYLRKWLFKNRVHSLNFFDKSLAQLINSRDIKNEK